VAILEDERLVELLVDRPDSHRSVGDIYVGKVEAVLPGIQAAFVDIGAEKSAFLHASDLIEAEEDEDPEDREPDDADEENGNGDGNGGGEWKRRRPAGSKAARRPPKRSVPPAPGTQHRRGAEARSDQARPGHQGSHRYQGTARHRAGSRSPAGSLVYMPFASKVGVSRKIEARDQRAKLREMVTKLVPADSRAAGSSARSPTTSPRRAANARSITLLGLWKKIKRKQESGRAPALLQRETSLTRGIVRDLLSDNVDLLLVDSKLLYNEVEQYLKQIDPELLPRVKLYTAEAPLFDEYDVEGGDP